MRDLLDRTISRLVSFANEADNDGLDKTASETMSLVRELTELHETAELRDQLWAACKRHAVTSAAMSEFMAQNYDWRLTDGVDELTEAKEATQDAIDRLCDKVAETET